MWARSLSFLLFSALILPIYCAVSWTTTPFSPPSVPLAVRSPYLSAWLGQGGGTALNTVWPSFWDGDTLGWVGFVNVDGVSYVFMGSPDVPNTKFNLTTQTSMRFTSTQSIFEMTAGPVDLTVQFLSPVEPSDLVNQSLPFSYFAVSAQSADGKSHSVQVYTDISGEWLSGDDSMTVNWTTSAENAIIHQAQLENQTLFADVNDRIQQGSVYYATLNTSGTTFQTGRDIDVRAQFINNSVLLNTKDTNFRPISEDWPVFALAHDFGSITGQTEPMVVAIGLARDPAIKYVLAGGTMQDRSSYFWTRFSTATDAVNTFLGDYSNALIRANNFDQSVSTASSNTTFPPDYESIVTLSIRQALAGIEITVSKDSSGSYNTSDVTAFLKEIGSSERVSTVDTIFAAWPLWVYTNPEIAKALLIPLLEYQASGLYTNQWAAHDLGYAYPQAVGYPTGNATQQMQLPIEETGNMLIMTLSHAQWSNDTSLIKTYYNSLSQWAQYLVDNCLKPANQLSTDVFAGALANQTNLAIKGIIGIKAMAEMAALVGNSQDNSNFNSIATNYVQEWQTLAAVSDGQHLTLNYGNGTSWGLTYNMYADKLLKTNLIPNSVYEMQTSWYAGYDDNGYGIALDTRHTYTLTGWMVWTAAFVTDPTVRAALINAVQKYASDGQNAGAFTDWYNAPSGACVGSPACTFKGRPDVGAHLALLALSPDDFSITNNTSTSTSTSTSTASGNSASPTKKASSAVAWTPISASLLSCVFLAVTVSMAVL